MIRDKQAKKPLRVLSNDASKLLDNKRCLARQWQQQHPLWMQIHIHRNDFYVRRVQAYTSFVTAVQEDLRTYYISAAFNIFFAKDKSQETPKNSICCTWGKVHSHLHQPTETKSVFFSQSRGRKLNFNKKRQVNIEIQELLCLLHATINMMSKQINQ